jgi:YesN/AraC family two-component response regulator
VATILIVDDDIHIQKSLALLLEVNGHIVAGQASNGAEAIEMMKDMIQRPDIILMDYRMPVMNGVSATEKIITEYPNSRILFISADTTIASEAIQLGALEFLTKPVRSTDLFNAIEKVLSF